MCIYIYVFIILFIIYILFPAGESGFCYVHQVSGTMLQDYRHPGPVYGCDWRDADILATGCEDGRIRIFCVSKNRKEPVTELKGLFKTLDRNYVFNRTSLFFISSLVSFFISFQTCIIFSYEEIVNQQITFVNV